MPPSNDNFADAENIYLKKDDDFLYSRTLTKNTDDATSEAGELNPTEKTIWYKFTPTKTGLLTLDVTNSDFSARVFAFLNEWDILAPRLKLSATAPVLWVNVGNTYYIQVCGTSGSSGNAVLDITFEPSSLNIKRSTMDSGTVLETVKAPNGDLYGVLGDDVIMSTDDGDTWSSIGGPDTTGFSNVGFHHIAVDSQNNIHILWWAGSNVFKQFLYHSEYDSSAETWGSETEMSNSHSFTTTGLLSSIQVDSSDDVYVVYNRGTPSEGGFDPDLTSRYDIYYRKRTSGSWGAEVKVTNLPTGHIGFGFTSKQFYNFIYRSIIDSNGDIYILSKYHQVSDIDDEPEQIEELQIIKNFDSNSPTIVRTLTYEGTVRNPPIPGKFSWLKFSGSRLDSFNALYIDRTTSSDEYRVIHNTSDIEGLEIALTSELGLDIQENNSGEIYILQILSAGSNKHTCRYYTLSNNEWIDKGYLYESYDTASIGFRPFSHSYWPVSNNLSSNFIAAGIRFIEIGTSYYMITVPYELEHDCAEVRAIADTFSGLDHLEDETVAVLADGKVLDQVTVSNGSVTLPDKYGIVHIGLPYYSDMETLDIEIGSGTDTLQGRKIKVGNIMYRFVESKGGWIGPDEDNLYEAFTDLVASHNATELKFDPSDYTFVGQDINDPDPYLYTGDIRKSLGAGYRRGGRSFFRQVDPTPVTITAIIPEIQAGGPR